jgi:hypothetical protein
MNGIVAVSFEISGVSFEKKSSFSHFRSLESRRAFNRQQPFWTDRLTSWRGVSWRKIKSVTHALVEIEGREGGTVCGVARIERVVDFRAE